MPAVYSQVYRALRQGRLTKPKNCEKCGIDLTLQGHHEDYSNPLKLIWLCPKCHGKKKRKHYRKRKVRIKDSTCLTVADVAKNLGFCETWVYRKIKLGILPYQRIGRMIVFSQKDIDDFMNTHKIGGVLHSGN